MAARMAPDLTAERATAGADLATTLPAERLTAGERLADAATAWLGSWRFIAVQTILMLLWIALNTVAWRQHWDPYPFILLNLALSFQAAFAAPVILMSQNRQEARDRFKAEADYAVDRQAERDIAEVHARLDDLSGPQWEALLDLQRQQLELLAQMEALTREVHRATIR